MNQVSPQHQAIGDSNGQNTAPRVPQDEHEGLTPQDLPRIGAGGALLIGLALIVLLGALFVAGWIPHQQREAELLADAREARESVPVVEVIAPRRESASSELVLPGDVLPMQETAIFPRASGYLKTLKVDIGDSVKAGQLLAEISSPEVDAQLLQANATLSQAQVTVGRANNEFNFNQGTYDRYEGLHKTGGVTDQQLAEKRAALNIATSSLKAAQASVKAAEAEVQRYTELQSFEKVYAPFDGTITARNYDLGALLSPTSTGAGKELFRIAHTDTLRVFVNVPQSYVTAIKTGQEAQLLVRNYPGRPFIGMVTRSTGALDPATRTLKMQVDFPNRDHLLFPGMYGQVSFSIHSDNPTVTVPTSALVYGSEGMKVAVVDAGKIHYQKVSVGRDFGTEAEVDNGLSGTEQIVANPGERLAEGMEVKILGKNQREGGRVAAAR